MTEAPEPAARPIGLIERVAASYRDVRGAVERLIAERPPDATLLSFLILAMTIHAFGGIIELAAALDPAAAPEPDALQSQVLEVLISRILVGALGVYLGAALLTPIARAFGGTGGWYETRVATIWAVLLAAPPLLLRSIVLAGGAATEQGATGGLRDAAMTAFLVIDVALIASAIALWAGCLAAAHQFRSPARVLGVSVALLASLAGVIWALGRLL